MFYAVQGKPNIFVYDSLIWGDMRKQKKKLGKMQKDFDQGMMGNEDD